MNKIVRVFFEVDMRNGLDGLLNVALEQNVEVDNLASGEFLVFINSRRTIMKLFASKDTYAYFRSPNGMINLSMIQHIPQAFNGTRINFDEALKQALIKGGVKAG